MTCVLVSYLFVITLPEAGWGMKGFFWLWLQKFEPRIVGKAELRSSIHDNLVKTFHVASGQKEDREPGIGTAFINHFLLT